MFIVISILEKKSFICKDCGKGFAQSSDLNKHSCIHTGEKPFVCKDCEKEFTTSSSLTRHSHIHIKGY